MFSLAGNSRNCCEEEQVPHVAASEIIDMRPEITLVMLTDDLKTVALAQHSQHAEMSDIMKNLSETVARLSDNFCSHFPPANYNKASPQGMTRTSQRKKPRSTRSRDSGIVEILSLRPLEKTSRQCVERFSFDSGSFSLDATGSMSALVAESVPAAVGKVDATVSMNTVGTAPGSAAFGGQASLNTLTAQPEDPKRKSHVRRASTFSNFSKAAQNLISVNPPRTSRISLSGRQAIATITEGDDRVDYDMLEQEVNNLKRDHGEYTAQEEERILARMAATAQMQQGAGARGATMGHTFSSRLRASKCGDPESPVNRLRLCLDKMICWWPFDTFFGILILINAATIGVETSYAVHEERSPVALKVFEDMFLCLYVLELGLRFFVYGKSSLRCHWVKFDCFLVASGILDFVLKMASSTYDFNVMLLRLLRLARLARAIRVFVQFQTLWRLVQGLLASLKIIFWTNLLILVFLYVYAVAGMDILNTPGDYNPEYVRIVSENFDDLTHAILTLLQCLTLDSVAPIYRPLVDARPELFIYFMSFFLIVSIALVNLVTALLVEMSTRQAQEDREAHKVLENAKKKTLLPLLKEMFDDLDTDGSGELEMAEILDAPEEVQEYLRKFANIEDLEMLFLALDYDGGGAVDIHEFCKGIFDVQSSKPMELMRIMKQCQEMLRNTRLLLTKLDVDWELPGNVAEQ